MNHKVHVRHCMLYEFQQRKNATQATESICSTLGAGILDFRTCQRWFLKFKNNELDLEDRERSGRPKVLESSNLETLLSEDSSQSTRCLAERLHVDHVTVVRRLEKLGRIQKVGKWVPLTLSENNINQRLTTCISLLARYHRKKFLWKIITGDLKWIYYENPINSKKECANFDETSISFPKHDVQRKKALLSVWWDMKGILNYELLEHQQSNNISDLFSEQLKRLNDVMNERRPLVCKEKRKVVLLIDNSRSIIATSFHQTIIELGWEVLSHPANSPDLAPCDYHLFQSLDHFLRGKKFKDQNDLKNQLDFYFSSKQLCFFLDGINKLLRRWEKVIENKGNYLPD